VATPCVRRDHMPEAAKVVEQKSVYPYFLYVVETKCLSHDFWRSIDVLWTLAFKR
jgi:hypothetical protein